MSWLHTTINIQTIITQIWSFLHHNRALLQVSTYIFCLDVLVQSPNHICHAAAVCVEASGVLEVSGHVGGEVSLHCSGNWTTDNSSDYNLYFCRGFCSKENTLIQTERKNLTVKRRGRYSMRVNRQDGAFNITITRLKKTDAGRYHCGVGKTFNVLYREVNLIVLNGEFSVGCINIPSGYGMTNKVSFI